MISYQSLVVYILPAIHIINHDQIPCIKETEEILSWYFTLSCSKPNTSQNKKTCK